MIVTRVEEFTKAKNKVYIDEQFAFVLYKGELRLYHVREGEELKDEDYRRIMEEVLLKRAKLRSMNLLQGHDYTGKQLQDKLRRDLYPEQIVAQAVAYVASFRYIDDVRYALSYIRCHQENKSRRIIEMDLSRKGVEKDDIDRAWTQWAAEGNELDEAAQIRTLLERKRFDARQTDEKECRKIYAFLMRRGFSTENIRKALKDCQHDEFYLT